MADITMRKELLGTNPDGSPHYNYIAEKDEMAIYTGPASAVVTAADGTRYDITDPYIGVPEHHREEVLAAIKAHYDSRES